MNNELRLPLAIMGVALSLVPAPHASAQSAVNLHYTASDGCPSEKEFVAMVESRGSHFADKHDGPARTFVVGIEPAENGFVGSFEVSGKAATSDPRKVTGTTCNEVTDALAVVTAIELRPVQVSSAAQNSSSTDPKSNPRQPDRVVSRTWWGTGVVEVGPGKVRFGSQMKLTLSGGAEHGLLPNVTLPRYDFTMERANFVCLPGGSSIMEGPILRLRATSFGPPATQYHPWGNTAQVETGLGLGAGLCYSPYFNARGLELVLCADFGVGQVGVTPILPGGSKGKTVAVGFGSIGVVAEAEYNLSSLLHAGVRAGWESVAGSSPQLANGTPISGFGKSPVYGALSLGMHFQ